MHRTIKYLFVGVLMLSLFQKVSAQDQWIVEKDLQQDLMVYYEREGAYGPLVGKATNLKNLHFFVNCADYPDSRLFVSARAGTALLIDQQLVAYWHQSGDYLLGLDSLQQSIQRDSIFFSLYHPGKLGEVVARVVARVPREVEEDYFPLLARGYFGEHDFVLVAALLVLAYYAFMLNKFPKFMSEYNNVSRAFSLRVRDEAIFSTRIISPEVLAMIGFYSLLLAFLYHLLFLTNNLGLSLLSLEDATFWRSFFNWLLIALLIYLAIFLKLILISMTNVLFKIKQFVQVQVFDYLRMSHVFYLGIFFISLALYLSIYQLLDFAALTFIQLVIAFALIRGILLYLKLKRISSYRKLQLFSYLCTTEILPLLLILKVFFIK